MRKYDQQEYDEIAALYYDYYSTGLEGDVQFYIEEARQADTPVLEIGCGTGRILLPMAEAGCTVIGLDQAPAMLALTRKKLAATSPETQERVELIEGDMRDFALGKRFGLITIPYRAFLHLTTPRDQRRALTCLRKHLTDNGHLVFNIFDPNIERIASHLGVQGSGLQKDSEFIHPRNGNRVVVWITRHYDMDRQMLEQDIIFEELDDTGHVISKTYRPLRLRYLYRHEMRYLLELCGFQVEELYGDFRRRPFRYGQEQIWVARRA